MRGYKCVDLLKVEVFEGVNPTCVDTSASAISRADNPWSKPHLRGYKTVWHQWNVSSIE